MPTIRPNHRRHPELRAVAVADGPGLPPALPLYHHPVVASSMIVVVASAVQIVVWLIGTRLPTTITEPNCLAVHGLLLDVPGLLSTSLTAASPSVQKAQFISLMLVAISSGVAWYAVARFALGPAWGLWTGLCWVCHPSFAFLAQRPGKLMVLIALVPLVWCALLWWERSRRLLAAVGLGLSLTALAWVGIQGVPLAPLLLLAMLAAPAGRGRRWLGAGVALATLGLLVGLSLLVLMPRILAARQAATEIGLGPQVAADLWNTLDDGDGSTVAAAAQTRRKDYPSQDWSAPLRFLWAETHHAPRDSFTWLASRAWRTLYTTAGRRLQRVLLAVQLLTLVPALWGYWVALRYGRWRWMAMTAGLGVVVVWLLAALAEPLARNLTPVGGFGVMFALVGLADWYERLLGRRLIRPEHRPRGRRRAPI